MKAQKQFGSMILIFTAIMMAIGFGKANAQVYKVSTDMRVSGELEVIDSVKTRNGFYQWNGSAWEGAGVGTPTLNSVLSIDNQTGGENINISDGDQIYFDNGSRIRKGITDMSNGGAKGVALVCSIDYELKWEAGRLYILHQDGFTIREVRYNFTITPTVYDDATKGFVIGSKWVMDDGLEYVCADSATGAAVWDIATLWSQSNGIISPVSANIVQANDIRTTGTYQFTTDSLDLGFATLPYVGSGGLYGNGFFLNGIGDFSSISFPNHTLLSGYLSQGGLSFMQIDTTSIKLRSVGSDGEDAQFETALEIFSDTAISGYQSLFALNARARNLGFVDISSKVDTKLRLQLSAFDRFDHQISYLGIDTEHVVIIAPEFQIQSNLQVVGYNTYPQFAVQSGSGQNVMSFLPYSASNNAMDFYVQTNDTSRVVGQATLGLNPYTGFNVTISPLLGSANRIAVDTVAVYLRGGTDNTEAKVNSNGVVLPSKSADPTGEPGAMYYNTTTHRGRLFENGAWRNL